MASEEQEDFWMTTRFKAKEEIRRVLDDLICKKTNEVHEMCEKTLRPFAAYQLRPRLDKTGLVAALAVLQRLRKKTFGAELTYGQFARHEYLPEEESA